MAQNRLKDGMVLGGFFGASLAFPKIGEAIIGFMGDIIPESWLFAGNLSIPIYIILIGLLIGVIVDKT